MAPNGKIPAMRILDEGEKSSAQALKTLEGRPSSTNSPNELVHVPALLRDLPGDLVGPHRVVVRLFAEAEVVAQVDQRHGDPEPHAEQGQHGGEGDLQRRKSPNAEIKAASDASRRGFCCTFTPKSQEKICCRFIYRNL